MISRFQNAALLGLGLCYALLFIAIIGGWLKL